MSFGSGAVQIPRNEAGSMTEEENQATKGLMKPTTESRESNDVATGASMREKYNKRPKIDANNKYMCADFILGSAAEVERVWSPAKYVLSNERRKLKPHMFEEILFLKFNERFCGPQLVAQAMRIPVSERTQSLMQELGTQSAMELADLTSKYPTDIEMFG